MNNVILSGKYPPFSRELSQRGYHVIESAIIDSLIPYERDHADMQCLILDDTAFVQKQCTALAQALGTRYRIELCAEQISGAYPANVALNCAVVGRYVIAREDAMEPKVREYCRNHGYQIIPVRQGYAKCSCAVVSDNAIITADKGIYNSLREYKINVLLIEQGRVRLNGAPYGFIGGASGLADVHGKRTLYLCGDVELHPDGRRIREFCKEHHTEIDCLSSSELIDIGGMIFC